MTSEVLANQSCQIMERRIPATVVLQPNQRHGVQVKQLDLGYVALRKKNTETATSCTIHGSYSEGPLSLPTAFWVSAVCHHVIDL